MKDIIDELWLMRAENEALIEMLVQEFGLPRENDPSIVALTQAHTSATQCIEILQFYQEVWKHNVRVEKALHERLVRENGERVQKVLQNLLFIPLLASIEHSIGTFLTRWPRILKGKFGDPLSAHVDSARRGRLVAEADAELWETAIKLRNKIVHNDGWATETRSSTYPTGVTIEMIAGQRTSADLHSFIRLSSWLQTSFADWAAAWGAAAAGAASSEKVPPKAV